MGKTLESDLPEPAKVQLPDSDQLVSMAKARRVLDKLSEEFTFLQGDNTPVGVARRAELTRQMRYIQKALNDLEPREDFEILASDSKQFPFRINETEYWPGTHYLPVSTIQLLRYMIQEHKKTEANRIVQGGDVKGDQVREIATL